MSQQNPTVGEATKYAKSYIKHQSMIKAFRSAFPKSKASKVVAYNKGSSLFKTDDIQVRIQELQKDLRKQSSTEFTLSVSELKSKLSQCIEAGLKLTEYEDGKKGPPFNIKAAVSAIAEFNKMDGNHQPAKVDHLSSDGSMSPKNFNDFYKENND